MSTNLKFLLCSLFTIAVLSGCLSNHEKAVYQNTHTNAAIAKVKKTTAIRDGKEADLNRAAKYAFKINNPALGNFLLDKQLVLTGPQITAESLLEQQVTQLQGQLGTAQEQNNQLLYDIDKIKTDKDASDAALLAEIKKTQALELQLAKDADEKAKDDSWGGLYGLFHYLYRAMWTCLYIFIGLIVLAVALRFASLWVPELGFLLSAVEHFFAFLFHGALLILPGIKKAAGLEPASVVTASSTPVTQQNQNTMSPEQHQSIVATIETAFETEISKAEVELEALTASIKQKIANLTEHKAKAIAAVAPLAIPLVPTNVVKMPLAASATTGADTMPLTPADTALPGTPPPIPTPETPPPAA